MKYISDNGITADNIADALNVYSWAAIDLLNKSRWDLSLSLQIAESLEIPLKVIVSNE